jgi:predicted Zn-dependent protease
MYLIFDFCHLLPIAAGPSKNNYFFLFIGDQQVNAVSLLGGI